MLTVDEVADHAQNLAQLIARQGETEAEFDGVKKTWKGRLEDIEREINSESIKVREKRELRLVSCTRTIDFDAGLVTEYRNDTGETLTERPISDAEKQKQLDFGGNDVDEAFGEENEG